MPSRLLHIADTSVQTAMFTAFTLAMLVYKAKDAVFTTDSDTILDPAALRQMSYVLGSDPDLGGVTGDVKIWNKNESWLALMCALRYWFAVRFFHLFKC